MVFGRMGVANKLHKEQRNFSSASTSRSQHILECPGVQVIYSSSIITPLPFPLQNQQSNPKPMSPPQFLHLPSYHLHLPILPSPPNTQAFTSAFVSATGAGVPLKISGQHFSFVHTF
jgi:hypothetical protein